MCVAPEDCLPCIGSYLFLWPVWFSLCMNVVSGFRNVFLVLALSSFSRVDCACSSTNDFFPAFLAASMRSPYVTWLDSPHPGGVLLRGSNVAPLVALYLRLLDETKHERTSYEATSASQHLR